MIEEVILHLTRGSSFDTELITCVFLLVSVVSLVSCGSTTSDRSASVVEAPLDRAGGGESPLMVPTESGSDASDQVGPLLSAPALTGRLVSVSTSRPLANVPVHLARVFWNEEGTDGAYILNTAQSPSAATASDGFFAFEDLDPHDYVLVVGEMPTDNVIVSNPDGSARTFTVERGAVTDIGKIRVDLSTLDDK